MALPNKSRKKGKKEQQVSLAVSVSHLFDDFLRKVHVRMFKRRALLLTTVFIPRNMTVLGCCGAEDASSELVGFNSYRKFKCPQIYLRL